MSVRRSARIARLLFRAVGWETHGDPPPLCKYVLLAAPHTSMWDFALVYLLTFVYDLRISFLMKHSMFVGPVGWWLRRVGGIPVRRQLRENLVGELATLFRTQDRLVLVVAPEGTRAESAYWKSGFYQVAHQAGVPVVLGYLDFGRRRAGFGPALTLSGDAATDMDEIRKFYSDKTGLYPSLVGPIRLREEDAGDGGARPPAGS